MKHFFIQSALSLISITLAVSYFYNFYGIGITDSCNFAGTVTMALLVFQIMPYAIASVISKLSEKL